MDPGPVSLVFSLAFLHVASSQFSQVPSDETVVAGGNFTFTCVHPNATTISWEKDGAPLSSSAEFHVMALSPNNSMLELIGITLEAHNGSYTCVAQLGGAPIETRRESFTVTVAILGDIAAELVTPRCFNGIFYTGIAISFNCIIPHSNPAAVNVSWYRTHDSMDIFLGVRQSERSVTSDARVVDTYVISDLQTGDRGSYFCRVDNGYVSRDSNRIELDRIESTFPTSIVTISVSNSSNLMISGNIVLSKRNSMTLVTCTFAPYFIPFKSFRWTHDTGGILDGSRGTKLLVDNSTCISRLFIRSTNSVDHGGSYQCIVDLVGMDSISKSFNLDIATIPQTYEVSTTPSRSNTQDPLRLGAGTRVQFVCSEEPANQVHNVDEEISWEFQRSGSSTRMPLVNGGRIMVGEKTLTIERLEVGDGGVYSCVASHYLVESIRTDTELEVEAPISLNVVPSVPMVFLGTPLSLNCTSNPSRSSKLLWTRGTTPINKDSRHNISFSSSDPLNSVWTLLTIRNVTESDFGTVSCTSEIANQLPVKVNFNIVESSQPYFVGNQFEDRVYIMEGAWPRLTCPIRRVPPDAVVHWEMGDIVFDRSDSQKKVEISDNNRVLQLLRNATVSEDDSSRFKCVVRSDSLELKYTFNLYITQPVTIIDGPRKYENATEGMSFQMTCKAAGRPPPHISWLLSFSPINDLGDPKVQDFGNGTLYFRTVEKNHSGDYQCQARSSLRMQSLLHMTRLTVNSKPANGYVGLLNYNEAVLIFALVAAVAIMIIVACITLIITICCISDSCCGSYNLTKQMATMDEEDSKIFLKSASLRSGKDNSGILYGGPAKPMFDSLQRSPDISERDRYQRHQVDFADRSRDVAMQTFVPDGNTYHRESNNYSLSSLDRGTTLSPSHTLSPAHTVSTSHKPSPPNATLASESLFEPEEEEEDLTNFPRINVQLGECLGQGEFGPVMKGMAKSLNHRAEVEVAIKLLVSEGVGEEQEDGGFRADLAVDDYANQMKLRHKNVVPILGICSDSEPYYIIYEYLDKGDLKHFLRSCRPDSDAPPPLSSFQLLHIVTQVAQGMKYLFSQHIIHGDIATRNCMISLHMDVKIGDLGIGHELYEGDYYDNGTQLLPIRWMPPELLVSSEEGPSFSLHSDIWAFGVFCWEVWSYAQLPYDRYSDEEVLDMVPAGSRLRNPSRVCPPELYLVMMDCWSDVPENRPQFGTICTALEQLQFSQAV